MKITENNSLTLAMNPASALYSAIIASKEEKTPVKIDRRALSESAVKYFDAYRADVESLQSAASALAASAIALHEDARRDEFIAAVSNTLRRVYARVGLSETIARGEVDAILTFVGDIRADKLTGKRTFVPAGDVTFRKKLEVFLAIRGLNESVEDKEARDAAKLAARQARKEARKAARKAAANA